MDYLQQTAPPVRENRLNASNVFGGTCSQLSKGCKQGCLKNAERSFAQTQGCQLLLSLVMLNTIRNSVIIIHAPLGCGGSNLAFAGLARNFHKLRDPNAPGLIWLHTNLDDTDVITGGEAKLKKAILAADKEFHPEAIIVVNSCVPALIGDDVDNVISQLKGEVKAKLVMVHCEGFKTKIMATAYDAVYHGLLRGLIVDGIVKPAPVPEAEEAGLKKKYRENCQVNLMNVASMSLFDEKELTRLLSALGLKLRILPCYAHPADFAKIGEAALNISICATHDDYFLGHLQSKLGIPYLLRTIPVGIKNTSIWLKDIAAFFGLEAEAEKLVGTETRELEQALAPYKKILHGKTAFLAGGEIRVLSTAELLIHLGMKVIGMKGYHFDEFAQGLLDELPEGDRTVFNVATGQPFEQANLLERLKPDIYVGHLGGNAWAAKHGVPIFPIFGQTVNYMGYNGVFEIARRLARTLRNPSFNRNLAANTRPPYREEWFRLDAFAHIRLTDEPVAVSQT